MAPVLARAVHRKDGVGELQKGNMGEAKIHTTQFTLFYGITLYFLATSSLQTTYYDI